MTRQGVTFSLCCTVLWSASAAAETVILKDGTFVEGEITLRTSRSIRVETRFGTRTFLHKDVDQILESLGGGNTERDSDFNDLPAPLKAVLNAQADYKLGNYDRALERLEPYRAYPDNPAHRIQIDWLIIEIRERLGRWEEARQLLKEKAETGTPRERIRAKAHLDLLDANPGYDLRYVGEKHARNFITDEALRDRAKEPGALRDAEVMRLALEEYCTQLLVEDRLSVKNFADRLDAEETYEVVKGLPPTGRLGDRLPYMDDLKRAEGSLYKAQSILGDYGVAYETDLVRTELSHLLDVFLRLAAETAELSPETYEPPSDPRTGQLTPAGRTEWRRRCDEFLERVQPLGRLTDYMLDKAQRYPRGLRSLNELLTDFRERLDQTVKAVKRVRERTHA